MGDERDKQPRNRRNRQQQSQKRLSFKPKQLISDKSLRFLLNCHFVLKQKCSSPHTFICCDSPLAFSDMLSVTVNEATVKP